ncbi:MAG TPA: aspartate dehydrogenase, partial [Candidatus Methanoperedens sp.]
MLKIGVIGCGTIGKEICRAIDSKIIKARLAAVFDKNEDNCKRLIGTLDTGTKIAAPDELIVVSDIVVECASQSAVRDIGPRVLERGKHLMVMSVGALMDEVLLENLIS